MSLTPEGELYLEHARRILGEIDDMEQLLGLSKATPQGLLRVNATLGFGRSHVAPLISRFVRKLPAGRGAAAAVGQPAAADRGRVRRLHPLRRAAGRARHRTPHRAEPPPAVRGARPTWPDTARPRCRTTWRGTTASASGRAKRPTALWRLSSGRGAHATTEAVKTRGNLTTNDGEIAVNWALDGHGILMRAEWDIERYLRSGRLVQVLPQYHTPDADIYAVYPQRHLRRHACARSSTSSRQVWPVTSQRTVGDGTPFAAIETGQPRPVAVPTPPVILSARMRIIESAGAGPRRPEPGAKAPGRHRALVRDRSAA